MLRAQLHLVILVVSVLLLSSLISVFELPPQAVVATPSSLLPCREEHCLVLGRAQSLNDADMYALELIPSISDTMAKRLLENKEYLLQVAANLEPQIQHRALERIKGIGPKRAAQMKPYLQFEKECSATQQSER